MRLEAVSWDAAEKQVLASSDVVAFEPAVELLADHPLRPILTAGTLRYASSS
jgi:hypothetical protein